MTRYDAYYFCPDISDEWAKQLAFDCIDCSRRYEKTMVYRVNTIENVFRLSKPIEPSYAVLSHPYSPIWDEDAYEFVEMKEIFDPINQELHYIGYGAKVDKIIVCHPNFYALKKFFQTFAMYGG